VCELVGIGDPLLACIEQRARERRGLQDSLSLILRVSSSSSRPGRFNLATNDFAHLSTRDQARVVRLVFREQKRDVPLTMQRIPPSSAWRAEMPRLPASPSIAPRLGRGFSGHQVQTLRNQRVGSTWRGATPPPPLKFASHRVRQRSADDLFDPFLGNAHTA
jgi:hypothetical protein